MKLAEMLKAYADEVGGKMLHRAGVAEMLVQLVENSRDSRVAAMEQFRTALVGYVNESIDMIKAADVEDKNELAAALRKLIEEMHADRRDVLAGEAPAPSLPLASQLDLPARDADSDPAKTTAGDRHIIEKSGKSAEDVRKEAGGSKRVA